MSLSKNQIKYIKSLQQKKFRQMYGNFTLEGDKSVKEILKDSNSDLEGLFALSEWLEKNEIYLHNIEYPIEEISNKELERISGLKTPNQVLAIGKQKKIEIDWNAAKNDLSFYLDNIQNPGNFGTMIRIADWFGIPNIFCSSESAELYNPKVLQSSMGSFLRVNVLKIEFVKLISKLQNPIIYGAFLDGENIFQTDLSNKGIIVIGNEGNGISEKTASKVTKKLSIPAHSESGSESLNAAVATGIICSIFRNQKV